jgi:CBS domain containing-hemolysin-like protein
VDAEFSLITVNKNVVRDAAAAGDRRSAGVGPLEQAGRAGPLARTVSVALVLATVLTRVLGELVPKNLAIARPLATARAVTVFQRAFSTVTGPLLTFFNGTANRIVRAVGIEPQEELASVRSPEELTVLVGHSARQGVLPEQTAELVQRSFAFGTRRAHDAMTPGTRDPDGHPGGPGGGTGRRGDRRT